MYPHIVHIEYWDNYETPWKKKTTNILIYAKNFTEITKKMENYFGNLIDKISIECIGDDMTFFEVSDALAAEFIKKEGSLR